MPVLVARSMSRPLAGPLRQCNPRAGGWNKAGRIWHARPYGVQDWRPWLHLHRVGRPILAQQVGVDGVDRAGAGTGGVHCKHSSRWRIVMPGMTDSSLSAGSNRVAPEFTNPDDRRNFSGYQEEEYLLKTKWRAGRFRRARHDEGHVGQGWRLIARQPMSRRNWAPSKRICSQPA